METKKVPKYRIGNHVLISKDKTKGYHCCSAGSKLPGLRGSGIEGKTGFVTNVWSDADDVWYKIDDYGNWITEDCIEGPVTPVLEKPTEYIKGKWYTNDEWVRGSYLKFNHIRPEEEGQIVGLEHIYADKHHTKYTEWSLFSTGLKEADMNIVSKFLPDGHPDKIKPVETLIVGKWYRNKKKDLGFYGKLTSEYEGDGSFPSTQFIESGGRYHGNGSSFGEWYPEDIELADMMEVSKHLPDGHPDKIVGEEYSHPAYARLKHDFEGACRGSIHPVRDGKVHFGKSWLYYVLADFEPATAQEYQAQKLGHSLCSGKDYSIDASAIGFKSDHFITPAKIKNEHVVHQSPVLIRKPKKRKQLFIVNI